MLWNRRRHYYIVTTSIDGCRLELYYWGKYTDAELTEKAEELNKVFPCLFLCLTGRGVSSPVYNKTVAVTTVPVVGSVLGSAKEKPIFN